MRIAILLIGFGHVGRRFVHLLHELKPWLNANGLDAVVVGIATRSRGSLFDDTGLDAVRVAQRVAGGDVVAPASTSPTAHSLIAQLGSLSAEVRVLVETTTLDVQSGEPAISHVRAAFSVGAHVISANKGPVAHAYRALADEARTAGRHFLFEGAVMDGIPIFNLVRETMPGVSVRGFRGVINSTTNHILTAMEQGEPFDAALARMQAAGVAEADPTLDVEGWDTAAKVVAMANVWMDARLTPQDVRREGITPSDASRVLDAVSRGERVKLVGRAHRTDAGVEARVQLETLAADDPLGSLDGQANALEIDTDILGRVVITQRDGGLEKTAYALFADLISVAKAEKTSGVFFGGRS
ncbi:MAG: homoserine dehydrogenase [Vicinamibacterales bacterium]